MVSPEETTVSVKVIERPRRERGLVTGRRKTEEYDTCHALR